MTRIERKWKCPRCGNGVTLWFKAIVPPPCSGGIPATHETLDTILQDPVELPEKAPETQSQPRRRRGKGGSTQ